MAAKKQSRPRHVPQRTCIVCRRKMDKRELIRIVRPPAATGEDETIGMVFVDPTGKQSGRGAYLCTRPECWEKALHTTILDRALKTTLTAAARASLAAQRPPTSMGNKKEPAG